MEVERVLNEAETMQYSLSLELAEQTKIATLLQTTLQQETQLRIHLQEQLDKSSLKNSDELTSKLAALQQTFCAKVSHLENSLMDRSQQVAVLHEDIETREKENEDLRQQMAMDFKEQVRLQKQKQKENMKAIIIGSARQSSRTSFTASDGSLDAGAQQYMVQSASANEIIRKVQK